MSLIKKALLATVVVGVLPACDAALDAPAKVGAAAPAPAIPAPTYLAFDFWGKAAKAPKPGYGAYTYVLLPGIKPAEDQRLLAGLLARGIAAQGIAKAATKTYSLASIPVMDANDAWKVHSGSRPLVEKVSLIRYDDQRSKVLKQWACHAITKSADCGGGAPLILASDKPLSVDGGTVTAPAGTRIAMAGCLCGNDEGAAALLDYILHPEYGRASIAFPGGASWLAILVTGTNETVKKL